MAELATKVVTGLVRFSYVHVFEPHAMSDTDKAKYSVCVLIPKSDKDTLTKIKKAIEAAKESYKSTLQDKNGKIPVNLKTPLRDGDDERPDDEAFASMYFLNANSTRRPQVVDENLNPIIDASEFYSGCYGRVSLNFYGYNVSSKGIAAGLQNVQKLKEGEPLTGGSTAAEDFGSSSQADFDDLM